MTSSGTYNIAVFAMDTKGTISIPVQTTVTTSNCLSAGNDASIPMPCAEYNGTRYGFTLDLYSNPNDASGLYWKMDADTLTGGTGTYCIPVGSDLAIPVSCVEYVGTKYEFTLNYYSNPADPSGLYWKMDRGTLKVK
ncbi:MAG: hypothetical protein HQ561_19310 [Desulfobacteraceae bacterium]|nr:hypothetical protein [Desulfobacteraceae bacterium]